MTDALPPYRRIVHDVRRRIEAGELRPGDRVPSARAITKQWGVAIATATKAHAALREEGLTISRPGVGTVVAGPAPRRDHELTRDRIVATAIEIADADGLGELSLPARHPAGWRAALELVARLEWAGFQRHPWLGPSMSLTRPQLAPNAMRLSEWVMSVFDGTRLPVADRMYVQILIFTFVRGVASAIEPEVEAIRETGITNEQWVEEQTTTFLALTDANAMTNFRALTSSDFDFDLDLLFEFGLGRLLDGLTPWITARS
jgi:DNA-binding transcriptional regulator YhcF (GntR family)